MIEPDYKNKQLAAMLVLEGRGQHSSTVPMMSDYANDERLCLTAAAFLPDPVQREIGSEIVGVLKKIEPHHYFYNPGSFHITIQNVRRISSPPAFNENDIATAIEVLEKEFTASPPLEFELAGVLRLPTSMAIRAFAQPILLNLVQRTRNALQQAGLPDDKEYVSNQVIFGNVTICRYTSEPSAAFLNHAETLLTPFTKFLTLNEVRLISTNAACHPAFTKTLATFKLA